MRSTFPREVGDAVFYAGASVFQLFLYELTKQAKNVDDLKAKLDEYNIDVSDNRHALAECLLKNRERDIQGRVAHT
jgi:hypothetical protein